LSTRTIIFTTDEERESFAASTRKGRGSLQVVPIASNVPKAPGAHRTTSTVIYFGQIRPNKGLEAFLDVARLSSQTAAGLEFQVIGARLPRHEEYLLQLQSSAPERLEWIVGADLNEVALRMSSALAAYLPFPDGASYRRGSLIAALVNGVPVVSTSSHLTPDPLARVILKAETPQRALAHLRLLHDVPEKRLAASAASRSLGLQFSWSSVAEAHLLLYKDLLPQVKDVRLA
jgi:glycosyltransferase involved in cell wall biosynthesis